MYRQKWTYFAVCSQNCKHVGYTCFLCIQIICAFKKKNEQLNILNTICKFAVDITCLWHCSSDEYS